MGLMDRCSIGKQVDGEPMVSFRCPGCKDIHQIRVGVWTFNDNLSRPTFSPSVLVHGNQWPKDEFPEYYKESHSKVSPGDDTICHSFVTDGKIQFLADCTHDLAGQTVELPAWRDE